ncbi:MAG: sulfatase-like hydrolase/transferase [Verrucomicrobiota bacterium JB024]|nr:sulfatase-like hydrolase/transferase [Verrucomicrobiota bacterium JB024]
MPKPPNILVLLTDDHAQWALSVYGDPLVRNPHIEQLAAEGVTCDEAYTPCPVCSPARASFFTGGQASQHGIHDWLAEHLGAPQNLDGQMTLAQRLQKAGYRTGLVGKWHCGKGNIPQPGFDYYFSYTSGQYPHRGTLRFTEMGEPREYEGYNSDPIVDKACEFLAVEDERPWFLFVGLVNTHSPFCDHPEHLVQPYRDALAKLPVERPAIPADYDWARFALPKEDDKAREWLAQYYGAVTAIDEAFGKIRAAAPDQPTLTIYTADHGHMNGQHGLYTKGNATGPQNFLEESVRIPLVMSLPGTLPAGVRDTGFIDHCDLHLTLLEVAGAEVPAPEREALPGVSQWERLRGKDVPEKTYQFFEYGNARAVKDCQYKLIERYAPYEGPLQVELYDLVGDPDETCNLAGDGEFAPVREALLDELHWYFNRYEKPEFSAKRILDQPPHNPWEPWRLERPAGVPSGGVHFTDLGKKN